MTNIFLSQPHLDTVETRVLQTRQLGGSILIEAEENILRPAGGGQPRDYGDVITKDVAVRVAGVVKQDGATWLNVPLDRAAGLEAGSRIRLQLDSARRDQLSRNHSLTHLLMAAARREVPGYESKGADISEDGAQIELRFRSDHPLSDGDIMRLDLRGRGWIAADLPVLIEKAKSIANAEHSYGLWRIDPDLGLTGRIRVIHIPEVDANPCSGSHVASTGRIGPFAILDWSRRNESVNVVRVRSQQAWSYWHADQAS